MRPIENGEHFAAIAPDAARDAAALAALVKADRTDVEAAYVLPCCIGCAIGCCPWARMRLTLRPR